MGEAFSRVWANPYVRVVVALVALALLVWLLQRTVAVWVTVLAAFIIAYLLNPLILWFECKGYGRAVGVLAVFAGFLLLLVGAWFLGVAVAAEVNEFVAELPEFVERIEEVPFLLARLIDPSYGNLFQQVFGSVRRLLSTIFEEILPGLLAQGAEGGLLSSLAAVAGGGFQVVMTLVLSIYLLYRFPVYTAAFLSIFPDRHRATVEELSQKASFSVGGYIRGQLIIAASVGLMTWLGLTIIGVPLAALLGILAGVFNLIPLVGPILVSIPTAVLAVTVSWEAVLGALLVLIIANQLDAHVLTPLIFSRTISVDPVTVIVAIFLGSTLLGLWGAIIAVPIAVFLKLLYDDYYRNSRWYRKRVERAP